MPLQYEALSGHLHVRWVRSDGVRLSDRTLDRSFLLTPAQVEPWPATSIGDIDEAAIGAILDLDPELVLLGTGERQVFPPPSVLARFLSRGVGIEVMDNAAVARTFNLLAAEGRRIVAAFLVTKRSAPNACETPLQTNQPDS